MGAFVGNPKPIGIVCPECRRSVMRAYTPAELTGWVFGYFICGCTALFQLGQLADPTPKRWSEVVAEAQRLHPSAVALRTAIMEQDADAGGNN
jgi:hypothetical protein